VRLLKFPAKARFGPPGLTSDSDGRHPQRFSRLFYVQSAEIAELEDLGLAFIQCRDGFQCIVQSHQIARLFVGVVQSFMNSTLRWPPPLLPATSARA
jgi:hypothetical protein